MGKTSLLRLLTVQQVYLSERYRLRLSRPSNLQYYLLGALLTSQDSNIIRTIQVIEVWYFFNKKKCIGSIGNIYRYS